MSGQMQQREASELPQLGVPIPFTNARQCIIKEIADPPLDHQVLRYVYRTKIDRRIERTLTKKEQRIIRQLRSFHCSKLQSYAYKINRASSPLCLACKECPDDENLHWEFCPILIKNWDAVAPSPESLWEDTTEVVAFLKKAYPNWIA